MEVTFSKTVKDSGLNMYMGRQGTLGGFCAVRVNGAMVADLNFSLIDGRWTFRFQQDCYGIGNLEIFNDYDRMSAWGVGSFRKGLKEAKRIAADEITAEASFRTLSRMLSGEG